MIIKDFIPKPYLEILSNRNFLILALTNLFTQLATAFLVLTLIVSAFLLTKNNFAVSGVVISLAMPAFLLMALAGVIADIFDRKKVILGAILYIAFVVFLILTSISSIAALISLAFFYNAGSSFLIPAIEEIEVSIKNTTKAIYKIAPKITFLRSKISAITPAKAISKKAGIAKEITTPETAKLFLVRRKAETIRVKTKKAVASWVNKLVRAKIRKFLLENI